MLNGFSYFSLRGIISTDYLGFLLVRLVNNALSNRCYLICEKRPLLTQMVEFGLALNSHRCTCVSRIQWAFNEPRWKLETKKITRRTFSGLLLSFPCHTLFGSLTRAINIIRIIYYSLSVPCWNFFILQFICVIFFFTITPTIIIYRSSTLPHSLGHFFHNRVFLLFFKFEENNNNFEFFFQFLLLNVSACSNKNKIGI